MSMRAFKREQEPEILAENSEHWGIQWKERKEKKSGASFFWPQRNDLPLNQHLLPVLKAQTQEHCSFCDIFPVSPPGEDTIEHFRPKSEFPLIAYKWDNLYYCCSFCQKQKLEKFDENLLQPDFENYNFDRYFRWDYTNGHLLVNELASKEDKLKAETTLHIYGLNEEHPPLRRRELRRRAKDKEAPLDDFAYRNFIENGE